MQRYFEEKHRIRKLYLELPHVDENIEFMVDEWIGIAVQNQVEELRIKTLFFKIRHSYRLPEILFSAKSLKILNCKEVSLPYYETMELTFLQSLTLDPDIVDIDMLQRIIFFCPLIDLDITKVVLDRITLPWMRKKNEAGEKFGNRFMQCHVTACPLRKFVYCSSWEYRWWPWTFNVGALKNLRKVEIVSTYITDDIVSEIASGLVALESLVLSTCLQLRHIQISNISLKEFHIIEGLDLKKVTIDAQNLLVFWYNCEIDASLSLISAHGRCNAQFCPLVDSISVSWFVRLKKFLKETNIFKCMVIDLPDGEAFQIVLEEDMMKNINTDPPYKLGELKLREKHDWIFDDFTLIAFLEGLFWTCHPDVLSITRSFQKMTVELILNTLKEKMHDWKHPLKSI